MSILQELDIVIASETGAGQKAQNEILEALQRHAFSERDMFAVRLALEEAVVNAIKHGNRMDPRKTVRIACRIWGDRVIIEVEDQGTGFSPADVPDPTLDENLDKASGRGLMLMRSFLSRVEFNTRGNCVTMEKVREVPVQ